MAITAEWDAAGGLWRLDVGRFFSLEDVANVISRTDWKGATRYLWDLRDLEQGPDSAAQLRDGVAMVEGTRKIWVDSRVAILVTRNLDYGIARMFQVFADELDIEFRAFREEVAALEWLGVQPPD